jgi:hypothetical protein
VKDKGGLIARYGLIARIAECRAFWIYLVGVVST